MRRLVALVVLAGLLLVVDQGARLVAEGKLAERARAATSSTADAEATISSFPFLGRLLVSGSVARVQVRVERSAAGPVRLASLTVDARGVALDRGRLVSGEVRVEGIDTGVVAVELDAAALSETLEVPVTVSGGAVTARVRGVAVTARPEVGRDGSLVLRLAGLPALSVPVRGVPLMPCAATDVTVAGERVRLTCRVDELPAELRR